MVFRQASTPKASRFLGIEEPLQPPNTNNNPFHRPHQGTPRWYHNFARPGHPIAAVATAIERRLAGILGPSNGRNHVPSSHERLLDLCNDVRASLRQDIGLGWRAAEVLKFLTQMLKNEEDGSKLISFDTVSSAKLDLLVEEMVNTSETRIMETDVERKRLREAKITAAGLQRWWVKRFGSLFFELAEMRYQAITSTGGALGDLECVVYGDDLPPTWRVADNSNTAKETDFALGRWWLNLAAAHRDGMVNSSFDGPSKGPNGMMVVPLLVGREDEVENGALKYVCESTTTNDLPISLMTQVGSLVRILRGHRLNSALTPTVGVRYDGVYHISQYGLKLDPVTHIFRITILFERAPGQPPLSTIHPAIPRPSQFDDWTIYMRREGEFVRYRRGDVGFLEWRGQCIKERAEIKAWRGMRELKASVDALEKIKGL